MLRVFQRFVILLTVVCLGFLLTLPALAEIDEKLLEQKIAQLEARIATLETYIDDLAPRLNSFSTELYQGLDQRMMVVSDKVAVLNPISRKFQKIVTNSGDFLIAVDEMQKIENGYRLTLRVGNPHAASFSELTLQLFWGKKWDPANVKPTYDEWRQSLTGAQFSFSGTVESGKWTKFVVDLTPARPEQFEYIECTMQVGVIKLLDK